MYFVAIDIGTSNLKAIVTNQSGVFALLHGMSRTLITSFNIFLFVFGGSSMRGFAFALMIGILAVTYSSIFVATPLFVDLTKGELKPIDEFTPSNEPVLKSFTKEETAK
jgi:preprotein translocase subunit SecF